MVRHITLPEPQGICGFVNGMDRKVKHFLSMNIFSFKNPLILSAMKLKPPRHTSHIDASTGTERTNHLLQYQFVYITTIKQYYKPKPSKDYAIAVHLALYNFLIWNKKNRVIPSM